MWKRERGNDIDGVRLERGFFSALPSFWKRKKIQSLEIKSEREGLKCARGLETFLKCTRQIFQEEGISSAREMTQFWGQRSPCCSRAYSVPGRNGTFFPSSSSFAEPIFLLYFFLNRPRRRLCNPYRLEPFRNRNMLDLRLSVIWSKRKNVEIPLPPQSIT